MKKLLAGCAIVAFLGLVALGVAAYFGYRAARPMIEGATTLAQQAREMAAESDRIENTSAFDAPVSGELDERRVQRFLAVYERVEQALGARWEQLNTRAQEFEAKARAGGRDLSLTEMGTVLSDLGSVLVDARRAHVDALNAEGFSSAEYAWARMRIYEAAGLELVESVDWRALESMVKQSAGQAGVEPPEMKLPEIPAVNRALVKPHLARLQAWFPVAMLGF